MRPDSAGAALLYPRPGPVQRGRVEAVRQVQGPGGGGHGHRRYGSIFLATFTFLYISLLLILLESNNSKFLATFTFFPFCFPVFHYF